MLKNFARLQIFLRFQYRHFGALSHKLKRVSYMRTVSFELDVPAKIEHENVVQSCYGLRFTRFRKEAFSKKLQAYACLQSDWIFVKQTFIVSKSLKSFGVSTVEIVICLVLLSKFLGLMRSDKGLFVHSSQRQCLPPQCLYNLTKTSGRWCTPESSLVKFKLAMSILKCSEMIRLYWLHL